MTQHFLGKTMMSAPDLQKREKARSNLKTVITSDTAWTILGSGHWRDLVPRRPAGINVTTPLAGVGKTVSRLSARSRAGAAASVTEPGADTITDEASAAFCCWLRPGLAPPDLATSENVHNPTYSRPHPGC